MGRVGQFGGRFNDCARNYRVETLGLTPRLSGNSRRAGAISRPIGFSFPDPKINVDRRHDVAMHPR